MTVDPRDLQRVVDGRWVGVRDDVRAQLGELALNPDPDLSTEEYRELTTANLRLMAESRRPHQGFDPAYGGGGDVGGVVTAFAMLGYGDLSLLVKAGVQWGLFGGAVQVLGTSRHHDEYLRSIMDGELLGCFAMTETGHGSDVQHLRTTATYDPASQDFVIHTPDAGARKDYIGNAARDGRMAVVFAQLITGGTSHGAGARSAGASHGADARSAGASHGADARSAGASHGVHAFLVPIRTDDGTAMPGVTIGDCGRKAGLNGVDNGRLAFERVRVPRENLLNRFADVAEDGTYSSPIENESRRFFTMLGTLVRGRISVAGGAVSATEKALALAIRYGATRRQFNDPATGDEVVVLDYLVHQRKLLPALATTYALHFAQSDLVSDMHDLQSFGEPGPSTDTEGSLAGASTDTEGSLAGPSIDTEKRQRDLETRAAGIKAVGTWHGTRTIQTCREACGGAGYLAENLLPQLKADTDVFTTFEGDNTVLLQLVAKTLLSDFGRRAGKLDLIGKARFAADMVVGEVAERTGVRTVLSRGDLNDRAHQRTLFAAREEHLLARLALRMRKALAPGAEQFVVFNSAQDHLLEAARAHVDRIVFDSFATAVDAASDLGVKALLEKVLALHALSTIEADRAWFVEHGYLTSSRTKAVTAAVNRLCGELRPHARTLVDGFGIPQAWLDCPLLDGEHDATAAATDPRPASEEPSDLASVG